MKYHTNKFILASLFLLLSLVLPLLFSSVPNAGQLLQPMHFPIFVCAFVCGWKYGTAAGFITPLLRSVLFGHPVFYPNAIAMAFELAAYAFVAGILFENYRTIAGLFLSLVCAMSLGRIVWAGCDAFLLELKNLPFSWSFFIETTVVGALPGILLQLAIIPAVVIVFAKAGVIPEIPLRNVYSNV